jgi:hypothetical protein
MGKKWGNKKESCLCKGRFPYECVLLRFGDTLGLMPLGAPPSREHTRMGTSATTLFLMNLFYLCHKGPCTLSCLFFMFMNGNSMDLVESRMAMVSGNNECMDRRSYLYCVHSMCAWHAWNRAWLKFGTNEGP